MKRCLEKGQIERFRKISKHLIMNRKSTACPKLVQGSIELNSYLDRIKKLHEDGYSHRETENAKRRKQFICPLPAAGLTKKEGYKQQQMPENKVH